jgi:hypothetical protein
MWKERFVVFAAPAISASSIPNFKFWGDLKDSYLDIPLVQYIPLMFLGVVS